MEVAEIGVRAPIDTTYRHNTNSNKIRVRVRRKTLNSVLEQCQRAIQLLNDNGFVDDDDDDVCNHNADEIEQMNESDELCNLLKSRVESPDFLEKLESGQVSVPQNMAEEGSTWDMVSEKDVWESGSLDVEEDYVLVRQEDIVDGIACFMAAYLLSLKETKELTPNQLQDALSKTFSLKKKKGKLRKAWDGSKLIYNVASWGATAIGIYQNPAILTAASAAFWTSCRVISKLL
ncbi:Ectopic P granules protein [Heracleum sosnowskyi]|uniref:Ectopic P granules protein n=1 Tax=Heracleum sosnowskyi TaxID=360622 RepID=A0AAD8JJF5_9APIA|nr:Ectopic P granules protein [Heracleum sosnowskyi]